ncbi:metal-sensitive transcriptional regulator [Chloroflexota bacterium]
MQNTKDIAEHYHYTQEKESLITRMKRIEGQAKGIEKMIEVERYSINIVQQLKALSSAADEVALLILKYHIESCVTDEIREGRGEDHIKERMTTIRKAMKH